MNGCDHGNNVIMIMLIYHDYSAVHVAFIMIVPIYMYRVKLLHNHNIKTSFALSYRNVVVHVQFGLL